MTRSAQTSTSFQKRILALIVMAGTTGVSSAQTMNTLYSTNFNSPTYIDGFLNTGADLLTPGQDGWLTTNMGGETPNNITVSNTAANGLVSLTTMGQDVRHGFAAVTSGSVYFDVDVTLSAVQATGDYPLHVSDGGTSSFFARTYFKSSGAGYVMALGTGSGAAVTYGTSVLSLGTTYHVLVRYDFVAGGSANDTGALFINPTTVDGSNDTAYVAATTIGQDATSISAVALRQGTAANAPTLTVDNFRAFTFTPVPEPASTLAFCGLAAAGLGGLRRLRRAAPAA